MPRSSLRFADTQASVWLDAVRALAAGVVLLDHWRNLFFVDFRELPAHRLLFSTIYLLAAGGHQAVVVFFVLSGYLISASVFRAVERHRWSWKAYATHRLVRLWLVLLPGLLLVFVLDMLGSHLGRSPAQHLYAGACNNHIGLDLSQHGGWRTALGNAAFLQDIAVPTFGSDGALWSLANEFWYYILFPLGLIACLPVFSPRYRIVMLLLFAATALWLPHGIIALFPIWLFGTALTRVPRVPTHRALSWVATAMYVAVFFAAARAPMLQKPWADTALGLLTAAWLWVLLSNSNTPASRGAAARVIRAGAGFSFSLYVVHTPVLAFLAAVVLPETRWIPTGPRLVEGMVLLAVAIAAGWLFASATELHTESVRLWVEQRLGVRDRRLQDAPVHRTAA